MLASVRTLALSRLAAALVAFALSGAPALAAAAKASGRACLCPSHARARACECARRAMPGHARGKATPCHPAQDVLSDKDSAPRSECGPSVSGACGTPEARSAPPRAIEAFTLVDAPARGALATSERIDAVICPPPDVTRRPEIPPPRHA
jgi:hypothetical protein